MDCRFKPGNDGQMAPRKRGAFFLGSDARNVGTGFPSGVAINKNYSSGATGGIAFAGACGAA